MKHKYNEHLYSDSYSHTPNWEIVEDFEAGGISHLAIIDKQPDYQVMVCSVTPMNLLTPTDRTHAQLIQAAPVMLRALIQTLQFFQDRGLEIQYEDAGDIADSIRAAIKQAFE